MAAGDATWNPQKGVAYRVTFPILDADGDLVTGATGLDSEVSKDGGTFADCTNEATEIATSSGVYYLDLTATEMNADTVAIIVKTSSSGAKTTVLVMYPLEAADMPVNVASVTGNVGGNVVGSVASVTGNVGGVTGVTFPATVSSLTAAGVRTELSTELGRIDVATSTRLASASYTAPLTTGQTAAAVWDALIASYTTADSFGARLLRSHSSQAEVSVTGSYHVAADVHETQPGTIHATTFDAGAIDAAALASDAATEIATATLTTAMTESYRAAGVAPTLAQAAFELIAQMGDASISGTTKTLKKIDGTTAKTFTLNDATTPTSITEAT